MANPYSDLTGNYIGANYNRAQDPNSQYGTRRLNFYVVEIAGYDIESETGWDVEQGTAGEGPNDGWKKQFEAQSAHQNEYLESPYSILYPVLRSLAIKGEVYLNGEPFTEFDGEYPYTYITVAMSEDTQLDGDSDWFTNNSWSIEETVGDALPSDFNWDYVNVYAADLYGYTLDVNYGTDSLSAPKGKRAPTAIPAARAARVASGKVGKVSPTKALQLARAPKN